MGAPVNHGIEIDPATCNACLRCVEECPVDAIVGGEVPTIDAEVCIGCGHCGAVCTPGAVRAAAGEFLPWRSPDLSPERVKALLVGRRSVRRYQPTPLAPAQVAEVLSVAAWSATATNSRDVAAIVVRGERLRRLGDAVNDFYARLARWLDQPILRPLLWLTPARAYVRNPRKLARVRARIVEYGRGRDWLFFDAPTVVVLTAARRNRRFGRVNAAIAAEQIQLYAASQGLGSCWIGYAEVALRACRAAREDLAIGRDREVHCVLTLGHPAVTYRRLPARAPLPTSWLE